MESVKLIRTEHFDLAPEELERLYTLLALSTYPLDRNPEYDQQQMLHNLQSVVEQFDIEIMCQQESDPNNLTLQRMHEFFRLHSGKIRKLLEKRS